MPKRRRAGKRVVIVGIDRTLQPRIYYLLPGLVIVVFYVLVGDEAYSLKFTYTLSAKHVNTQKAYLC